MPAFTSRVKPKSSALIINCFKVRKCAGVSGDTFSDFPGRLAAARAAREWLPSLRHTTQDLRVTVRSSLDLNSLYSELHLTGPAAPRVALRFCRFSTAVRPFHAQRSDS